MKSLVTIVLLAFIFAMSVCTASADRSVDCVAMARNASDFVQEKGVDYALKVFSASKGPFIDRELYVFVCSMTNKMLAHPYQRNLVGQDVEEQKDVKGNYLFKDFKRTAEGQGTGWVDYWWSKPGENGEFRKSSYIVKVPRHELYLGVGYYKD